MRTSLLTAAATLALTGVAFAEPPSVAVDIAPVHSLVARVMDGVGSPELIVQPGASPHGYSLRPAEAEALQNADIVFWVSESLTPWLERSIDSLAGDARSVELIESEGTTELEFREGATFEEHSHEDHADHEEHENEDHPDHEEHEHEEHEHAHHGHNPHAWLDPENASVWLDVIASNLADVDPEHADAYAANAAAGKAELAALSEEIDAALAGVRGKGFIVFHDAYHYFENRFGVLAVGSIRLSDATEPSPARIEEIRDKVAELNVTCVFSEPQFNPDMVETVFEGSNATVGVLDPIGSDLEPGPGHYPQLLRNVANNLTSCL